MSDILKVLKREGVPYVYDPENTEELTEEQDSLPQEGDWVEYVTGTSIVRYEWHEPVPEEPEVIPSIRKITKRSFMQRFTQPERTAVRNSPDDIVIDVYEDLSFASNVDLDLEDIENALLYFVALGILVEARVAEILVDGTEAEAYRGI